MALVMPDTSSYVAAIAEKCRDVKHEFALGSVVEYCDALPNGGIFTLGELSKWDGVQLPMCVGLCGKVLDVSSSPNFQPDYGYGTLWGGKDATYAFATMSLSPSAANTLDWSWESLSSMQKTTLTSWWHHFLARYPVVGSLKEYDGWDFSSIVNADKTGVPPEKAMLVEPVRGADGRLRVTGL
mmetsp:Transcript_33026/g.60553  ORF Transcript_33026/g.60553 Transcript_33026/m.60553 type:complete len:183 (+) Transcript_33026:41-589(+)